MKHVLITGGNKGIGFKTIKLFLKNNFKLTVLARNTSIVAGWQNCTGINFKLEHINEIVPYNIEYRRC
jgi:NAD(P)-dependent dehydrogenase (short-subunit alcohol dehydrogenase family)